MLANISHRGGERKGSTRQRYNAYQTVVNLFYAKVFVTAFRIDCVEVEGLSDASMAEMRATP